MPNYRARARRRRSMFFTANYRVFRLPCIRTVDHFPSNSQLAFKTIKPHPFSTMQFSLRPSSQPASLFFLDHIIIQDQDQDQDEQINKEEAERRRKIGLARKGKVPWNKGRNHTAETRALIVNRTREALKDPKVKSCEKEDVPKTNSCLQYRY